MVKGLAVYRPEDRVFNMTYLYQFILSGLATGTWYAFASKNKIIRCQSMLNRSLPVAFLLSLVFTKGIADQYVAHNTNVVREEHKRHDNYLDYKIELRNKKIIE